MWFATRKLDYSYAPSAGRAKMAAMGGKVHKLAVCEGKHEKGADWGVIKLP